MRFKITIPVVVLTDGPIEDVEAVAYQMSQCLDEDFDLITDDLVDTAPVVTVGEPDITVV